MNHNDIVRQSFKKQAEKFVAYHMSKVEMEGILAWEELDCYYGIKSLKM